MNCKQANENIGMREVLESFSLFPRKENPKTAYYYALDREERTPSLAVNFIQNQAFDFGTGKTYDVVSLVQAIKQCSVSEALEYLKRFDFSFQKQREDLIKNQTENRNQSNYEITQIKEVNHPALMDYLKTRKLESQKSELKEIHYELNGKHYFGLGFKNDSGGYEIRNSIVKICLGKKDIRTIKNHEGIGIQNKNKNQNQTHAKTLKIFEGFSDYMSFKILKNEDQNFRDEVSDEVILNSVSMLFKVEKSLGDYQKIEVYFDNDKAGDEAVEKLNRLHPNVHDQRKLYSDVKDLNDYLTCKNLEEKLPIEEQRIYRIRR